jgi:RNA polymerase sigma-70 factor (ECF subfamily)
MRVRGEVTELLNQLKGGRAEALDEVLPLVYDELCRLAGRQMRKERQGHTLQPTALVHEAFLRLVNQKTDWQNRAHFVGVAGQLMRKLLVDYARRRKAAKRGVAVTLDEEIFGGPGTDRVEEILAVDQSLLKLRELNPRQAQIAELRYFGGLSVEETAEYLNVSPRTVKADWAMARGWLRTQLSDRRTA